MKEFARYRSVYCGICKIISQDYGQVPRLATTYDMTFLALLLLAMEGEAYGFEMEGCILHPGQKRPTASRSGALEFTAALAVLLGWYKFKDDIEDKDKPLLSRAMALSFAGAKRKATASFPELESLIREGMKAQREMETSEVLSPLDAAEPFSTLLGQIMALAPVDPAPSDDIRQGMIYLGQQLGAWIYLIDAFEDYEEDRTKGRFNPLLNQDSETAKADTLKLLAEIEERVDLTAELLPYYRDAAIISNIIQMGLPEVRKTLSQGGKLQRV